MTLELQKP